jgi:hypothetical protein
VSRLPTESVVVGRMERKKKTKYTYKKNVISIQHRCIITWTLLTIILLIVTLVMVGIPLQSIELSKSNNHNGHYYHDQNKNKEKIMLSPLSRKRRSIIQDDSRTFKRYNSKNNDPSTTFGSHYPPLDKLVYGKYNVTGDVSFILDFAIIGFPKCGTSTMMEYLDQSPYTKVAQKERCDLGYGRQAKLVRDLYAELPEGEYKRGIKCPRDLENEFAMKAYTRYFPRTNFLIGLRHPILWLESFYNFRLYNNNPMPPVEQLVGSCTKYSRHVCTHRARFHQFLANLGKTSLTPDELQYFKLEGKELRLTPVQGKIFLYHVEQLRNDEPQLEQLAMRRDLSSFLGIPEVLPPIQIWTKPGKNLTQEQREIADQRRLDICHSNHTHIREYLIEQSTMTAEWILKYFLKSSDVYVSSPDRFRELIKAWEIDPCTSRVKV